MEAPQTILCTHQLEEGPFVEDGTVWVDDSEIPYSILQPIVTRRQLWLL